MFAFSVSVIRQWMLGAYGCGKYQATGHHNRVTHGAMEVRLFCCWQWLWKRHLLFRCLGCPNFEQPSTAIMEFDDLGPVQELESNLDAGLQVSHLV